MNNAGISHIRRNVIIILVILGILLIFLAIAADALRLDLTGVPTARPTESA